MDNIIAAAQQLSSEGKVPTTALLKSRLPKETSLPLIIQGLKMWQDNPSQAREPATATPPSPGDIKLNQGSFDALLTARIEQAVAPLQAKINQLQTQVSELQQLITEDKN